MISRKKESLFSKIEGPPEEKQEREKYFLLDSPKQNLQSYIITSLNNIS